MRIVYTLFCLIALPGVFVAWQGTMLNALQRIENYTPFILGMGIYIILYGIKSKNLQHNLKWFQVFSHELTHVIFSILTFNKIYGFNATSHAGGYVAYQGRTNMFILLSPYCIPIFTLILVIIAAVFELQQNPYMIGALGFTYIFHIQTFVGQTRGFQPDLREYGLITSYVFIILINLLMTGMIIGSITNGLGAFKGFTLVAWEFNYDLVMNLF